MSLHAATAVRPWAAESPAPYPTRRTGYGGARRAGLARPAAHHRTDSTGGTRPAGVHHYSPTAIALPPSLRKPASGEWVAPHESGIGPEADLHLPGQVCPLP